jgi:hypothetical protein
VTQSKCVFYGKIICNFWQLTEYKLLTAVCLDKALKAWKDMICGNVESIPIIQRLDFVVLDVVGSHLFPVLDAETESIWVVL